MSRDTLPRLIRSLHGLAGQRPAGVTDAELLDRFVAARVVTTLTLLGLAIGGVLLLL